MISHMIEADKKNPAPRPIAAAYLAKFKFEIEFLNLPAMLQGGEQGAWAAEFISSSSSSSSIWIYGRRKGSISCLLPPSVFRKGQLFFRNTSI